MRKSDVFDYMEEFGHEEVLFLSDKSTGLRGIIAIHNTTLGPAVGGVRIWQYPNEKSALMDALRLSRGMTYQSAIAGADFGGGKAVLWGTPDMKNEAYLRALGRFIQGLGGRFIAYSDLGTDEDDLSQIARETEYVLVVRDESGKLIDASKATAYGLVWGMKACCNAIFGENSLKEKRIAVQGVGNVGTHLVDYLVQEGASPIITYIDYDAIKNIQDKYSGIEVVKPDEIYDVDADIFSPCAVSSVIDEDIIERLSVKIIAGSANCVLKDTGLSEVIHKKGILFAPDFASACGNIITASSSKILQPEWKRFESAKYVYNIIGNIIEYSQKNKISTYKAAKLLAEERIERIAKVRRIQRF